YFYEALAYIDKHYSDLEGEMYYPDDKKIYIQLAGILLISKDYGEAKRIAEMGLRFFPNSDFLWEELAVSENELHHQQVALIAAGKAKELNSNRFTNHLYTAIMNKEDLPPIVTKIILDQHLK
ncbi:MAG TPA: hypothetical protein VEP90_17755, partial [Methylomirabilota bacterium]|nr:hypothetical protein [Methylomirabilota bacterium]